MGNRELTAAEIGRIRAVRTGPQAPAAVRFGRRDMFSFSRCVFVLLLSHDAACTRVQISVAVELPYIGECDLMSVQEMGDLSVVTKSLARSLYRGEIFEPTQ